jgi:hypothetical protein
MTRLQMITHHFQRSLQLDCEMYLTRQHTPTIGVLCKILPSPQPSSLGAIAWKELNRGDFVSAWSQHGGGRGSVNLVQMMRAMLDLIGSMISTGGCINDIVAASAGNGHAKDLASLPQEIAALGSPPLHQTESHTDGRKNQHASSSASQLLRRCL